MAGGEAGEKEEAEMGQTLQPVYLEVKAKQSLWDIINLFIEK